MSDGGVMLLISNDGRADQMILATSLLMARLDDIRQIRQKLGFADLNPTLADIERTHILYMNATFKPHAAFAFAYTKVQPQGGGHSWGNTSEFDIPQQGDFISDMALLFDCNGLKATPIQISTLTASGGVGDSNGFIFDLDGFTPVRDKAGKNLLSVDTDTKGAIRPFTRWCDYPGERAVEKATFQVNTNTLHEYSHQITAFQRKFELMPGKQIGYKRLVGQEVPIQGYSVRQGHLEASKVPADEEGHKSHRRGVQIFNGLQTPKLRHPPAKFWHRCHFWFNMRRDLMVPSAALPQGSRRVSFTLAAREKMVQVVGGKVGGNTNTHLDADTTRWSRIQQPVLQYRGTGINEQLTVEDTDFEHEVVSLKPVAMFTTAQELPEEQIKIKNLDLYINNIFVLPDIHDIYIHRIGFNLIRVYREQITNEKPGADGSTADQLMHQFKWPIERVYLGLQHTDNVDSMEGWWRMSRVRAVDSNQHALAFAEGIKDTIANDATNVLDSDEASYSSALCDSYYYLDCTNPVKSFKISIHGTELYKSVPGSFFSDYIPTVYGNDYIQTNDDPGSLMLSFALHPGLYDPSGHANVSRARELYFSFVTHYKDDDSLRGDFVGVAINFLLVSDGNAILRYTS